MKNYRLVLLLVLGILLSASIILGTSYALWTTTHTQTTTNGVAIGCFSTSFTEKNDISLNNAYPISDTRGLKTTPYEFTITNTCSINSSYQINLENINSSTLSVNYIKSSINGETPKLISTLSSTEKTITTATSSYTLTTGTLEAGASVTYNLRLWITEEATNEDAAGKIFNSKISVVNSAVENVFLADKLINAAGGKLAIEEKGNPDFQNYAPIVSKYKDTGFIPVNFTYSLSTTAETYYYAYADSYTYDTSTGLYSLVNPQIGKYNAIYSSLPGKYVTDYKSNSSNSITTSNIVDIYKIVSSPYSASASVTLTYNSLISNKYGTSAVDTLDATTSGMWSSNDDYGVSYYYRGKIDNNNILFGGYCWKAIRINGDGTTRMIYNGTPTNGKCTTNITYIGTSYFNSNHLDNAYIGYMYGTASSTTYEATHANINTSNIKSFIDNWYTTNLKTYSSKINDTLFCDDRTVKSGDGIGTNTTIYSAQLRKNNPILTCSQQNDRFTVSDTKVGNGKLTNPIGLITFDEVDMSGSNGNLTPNNLYYLYSNYDYWTITPYMYVGAEASQFYVKKDGDVGNTYGAQSQYNIRPVINLKSDVEYVSGDGTKNTPYQIS